MDSRPNELENAVLGALAAQEPTLLRAIGLLQVSARKLTGAGSYTDFLPIAPVAVPDGHLILDQDIYVPGVPGGLGAALAITAGAPEYLELFTYGVEQWDGTYNGFAVSRGA